MRGPVRLIHHKNLKHPHTLCKLVNAAASATRVVVGATACAMHDANDRGVQINDTGAAARRRLNIWAKIRRGKLGLVPELVVVRRVGVKVPERALLCRNEAERRRRGGLDARRRRVQL